MINELNEGQTLIQRGDTHMTSTLRGSEGVKALSDVGGRGMEKGGLASVLGVQSFYFIINKNWICAMTRYHVEPNINKSLTNNLRIDSVVRQ